MGPGCYVFSFSCVIFLWHVNLQTGKNQGSTSDHGPQPGWGSVHLSRGEGDGGHWEPTPERAPWTLLCSFPCSKPVPQHRHEIHSLMF